MFLFYCIIIVAVAIAAVSVAAAIVAIVPFYAKEHEHEAYDQRLKQSTFVCIRI